MKCPSCGSENAAGTKFCSLCGTKLPLDGAEQPTTEQSAQQPVPPTPQQPNNTYQNAAPQYQQYQQYQQYPQPPKKEPLSKQTWFVVLMLVLVWPVGLILMWCNKKEWKLPVKIIITAFFVLMLIIGVASGSGSSDDSSSSPVVTTTATTTEEATEAEETTTAQAEDATDAPTEAPTEAAATVDITKEGTYKVGVDIAAGEYCIFAMDSNFGGYYSVNADSVGDSIIGNENFDYNAFVTVSDGQYLELNRAMAIPAEQIAGSPYAIMTDGEGEFRIGIDLPAGEYKLESTDEIDGYYCVYDSSAPDAPIVTNENFSGQSYVTVSDGQYLLLSRCKIAN